jgi:hypothetical protein
VQLYIPFQTTCSRHFHSHLAWHQVARLCAEGPWQGISVSSLASSACSQTSCASGRHSQSHLAIQAHLACAGVGDSLASHCRLATWLQHQSVHMHASVQPANSCAQLLTVITHCWIAARKRAEHISCCLKPLPCLLPPSLQPRPGSCITQVDST